MTAVQKNRLSRTQMELFTCATISPFANEVPPKKIMSIDTGSRGPLRGFYFSHESNQFFLTSYIDGKIYGYEINGTLKNEFSANKIFTASGPMHPRSVIFLEALNKVVVSYESGLITFYDIGLPNFPVCSLIRLSAPA